MCEHELRREAESPLVTGRRSALVASVLSSPGQPLDTVTRTEMERKFGQNMASVRVHTDRGANDSALAVDADAYTIGRHIVFGRGRYEPTDEGGRRLLMHELTHSAQQGLGDASLHEVRTRAGAAAEREADQAAAAPLTAPVRVNQRSGAALARKARDRHITSVTVSQAGQAQSVKWTWSDGATGDTRCSTGKGHCCVDGATDPACSAGATRVAGSNLTPVGTFTVDERTNCADHPPFWTRFVGPPRYIALHQYSPVDGTPLSHGCVRMAMAPAQEINEGAREGVTKVHVEGVPSPLCANKNLQSEWAHDFEEAGSKPDGEAQIDETRSELASAFHVNQRGLDKKLAAAGKSPTSTSVAPLIPRCPTATTATAPKRAAAKP
jgi:hypothetical protein